MTATVGVLCARVRVEEKQLMAALAEAGALPRPLPPSPVPLPIGPSPLRAGDAEGSVAGVRVIVDRCRDRTVASAVLGVCRALGATVLAAGLAARGDRLAVAGARAAAGLPRPRTLLACDEVAALVAADDLGYPATLLPLVPGASGTPLLDRDAAEAVIEHRVVLGGAGEAVALIQAGAPAARATVIVVDGRAVGVVGEAAWLGDAGLELSVAAAAVVGAVVAGVELAFTAEGMVVWDILPIPDFRDAVPVTRLAVADAIALAALARVGEGHGERREDGVAATGRLGGERWIDRGEVRDGVALSA